MAESKTFPDIPGEIAAVGDFASGLGQSVAVSGKRMEKASAIRVRVTPKPVDVRCRRQKVQAPAAR